MATDDLCQNLTLRIGELLGMLQSLQSRITSLEECDRRQYQLIAILVAVNLGLNNPLTNQLFNIQDGPAAQWACEAQEDQR
ncbi:hypothetical protein L3556_16065 [Candidatus Synechococcus calcipolaris G9]|uniref:Uncharacterized protein n=1 Tax=Candidatus Synechococcus calcipolaris G9 TaxID=1497997 RepID=A0ABT6F3Q6_9SYNE|nr:hypothetical protein [Candidatus Synechococcus calcipolaris]MDG2992099.1 hypothetical protein [Candidatus Synechococcus calcipolaris G9]MDG2992435.1 hypothetical protein [Candidatus Synechococcus calcipolaris G9]